MEPHSVAEVMTVNPLTTTPKTPITDVVKLLSEKRISGLPVLELSLKQTSSGKNGELLPRTFYLFWMR
jgi:CBS domain-containing protein